MNIYCVSAIGNKAVPAFTDLNIVETNTTDTGVIQNAIEKAIQNTIVIPFQEWCVGLWSSFISLSHYVCLYIAMGGVIFYICGVEKGKKVATVSILIYVSLQVINWIILG